MRVEGPIPCVGQPAVAVIPAFRPTSTLCHVVDQLRGRGFGVVVVDDGSGPRFAEIFDRVETMAPLLRHHTNQGKGAGLRTGLEWVRGHCPLETMVVTVDADGQHLPDDVVGVCALGLTSIDPGSQGLVLGVRFDGPDTPRRSRFGHDVARMAFKAATGRYLVDTQTGLRAFRASMVPELLRIPGDRFEYEMNQLVILAKQGVPIHQVRITTVYEPDAGSHYRGLIDSFRLTRDFLRYARGWAR